MNTFSIRLLVAGCEGEADALEHAGYEVIRTKDFSTTLTMLSARRPPRAALVAHSLFDGNACQLLEHLSWRASGVATAVLAPEIAPSAVVDLMTLCDAVVPGRLSPHDLLNLVENLTMNRRPSNIEGLLQEFSIHYELSPRERELLACAVRGLNNDEAAFELGCARPTIATYWNRIFGKTGRGSQRDVVSALLRFLYRPTAKGRTSNSGMYFVGVQTQTEEEIGASVGINSLPATNLGIR